MRIEEQFRVKSPVQRVWDFMSDLERFGPCIPGCTSVVRVDDKSYKMTVKQKVGPVSVSFELNTVVTRTDPPVLLEAFGRGKDPRIASGVDQRITMKLVPAEAETDVVVGLDVTMSGVLGTLGQGVIKAKVKQMAEEVAAAVRAQVEAGG